MLQDHVIAKVEHHDSYKHAEKHMQILRVENNQRQKVIISFNRFIQLDIHFIYSDLNVHEPFFIQIELPVVLLLDY